MSPDQHTTVDHVKYVEDLRHRLEDAYKLALQESSKKAQRNKKRHDVRVKQNDLQKGDRVLVRNLGFKGPHKLADRWNDTVHVVLERKNPDMPVYRLKPERVQRKLCTETTYYQ